MEVDCWRDSLRVRIVESRERETVNIWPRKLICRETVSCRGLLFCGVSAIIVLLCRGTETNSVDLRSLSRRCLEIIRT